MPVHSEKKILPYTRGQLFDLVADVQSYPQFLPWCISCQVTEQIDDQTFLADLTVGYKIFRETFTSRVHLTPKSAIHVEYINGPMRNLSNDWKFIDNGDGTTTVDFFLQFDFHNPVLRGLVGMFFHEAFRRMVAAFEDRARAVYGPPKTKRSAK